MKFNPTISTLIASDIFFSTGFGLVQPILAIYLNSDIKGGSILTAGLASAIFIITKSLIQLPFSRHVDTHDDSNDLKWLIVGSLLVTTTPFFYVFANHISTIFLAQLIYGIGSGLAYPAWVGLWSTHLDKGSESFQWSFYSTVVGIGTALAAALGAGIANYFGFIATFFFCGTMCALGCVILISLTAESRKRKRKHLPFKHKLHLPYNEQQTEYTCGPASMKMIFAYFKIFQSEKNLAKQIKTNNKIGSLHSKMIATAAKSGLYCYVNQDSTIHEIKMFIYQDLPVIVHFIEPSDNEGHYAVIIGFRNTSLILNDPWNGKNFILSMSDFTKRWHDENNIYSQWIMVLAKKDLHLGKQYSPRKIN